ncbi:MAG: alpha/beta hydrolase [Sulfuriflexus sp.]|nr:alpha/beta hydrolase [Sulfuriflexus sp.]
MSARKLVVFIISLLFIGLSAHIPAQQLTPEEMEEWLFDDSDSLAIDEVNEGDLAFVAKDKNEGIHHHHNTMLITDSSLEDGWVKMEQCHRNLDAVPLAQILFSKSRSRNLSVSRRENIGKAWVEDNSIQLEDINKQAVLCIKAETRSLVYNGDGTYSLRSGPFMRRFLDGYYPMQVTMDIEVKAKRLRYFETTPPPQDGMKIWRSAGVVHLDAWFEGRLNTDIRFHDLVIGNPVALRQSNGRIAKLKAK